METLAMPMNHTAPSDPYAPWLNADDLALLYFHPDSPPSSSSSSSSSFSANALPSSAISFTGFLAQPLLATRATTEPTRRARPPTLEKSVSAGDHSLSSAPTPTPTLDSAEDLRRDKNRQKVRRHYYRKLTQLNALRSEVVQLESQFQHLVTRKQNETSTAVVASFSFSSSSSSPSSSSAIVLNDRVLQQVGTTKSLLEQENHHLRQLFAAQETHLTHLRQLFACEQELVASSLLAKANYIKPFTPSECYAVRDRGVADVRTLDNANCRRGPGFAGWQDHVAVEDGLFKFSLTKTFRHTTPASVCGASWPMLSDPVVLARLYSAAVECKCVLVQQVDDANVVMFQEYRTMDATNEYTLMKSLFVVSRVTTETGELLLWRGLGQDRLQDHDRFLLPSDADCASQIVWHDVFCWVRYDRAGLYGEDCTVRFGGVAPTVGHNTPFWTIEVLHLVLRWESAMYGPPKLLPSDAEHTSSTRTPPQDVGCGVEEV